MPVWGCVITIGCTAEPASLCFSCMPLKLAEYEAGEEDL